jgi:hypothetical protein
MNASQNQCKRFLPVATILVAFCFAPSIAALVAQALRPVPTTERKSPQFGQAATVTKAAQAVPLAAAIDRSAQAQAGTGLIMPDISGVWANRIEVEPGVAATYRFELAQTGNVVTGKSHRTLQSALDESSVVFSITGRSIESGKAFTFQEGQIIERDPPNRPWCAIRAMTLVPTAKGALVGSLEDPPCPPGTMVLYRMK